MRRHILLAVVAGLLLGVGSGCVETKKPRRSGTPTKSPTTQKQRPLPTLGGSPTAPGGGKRPKGPKTMGGLMVDAWKQDLSSPSTDKRILAAKELANMGSSAKAALPALESMASDRNPQVAAAAKAAIAAIRK